MAAKQLKVRVHEAAVSNDDPGGSSASDQDLPESSETSASPGVPYQVSPPTARQNLAEHVGAPTCQDDSAYSVNRAAMVALDHFLPPSAV